MEDHSLPQLLIYAAEDLYVLDPLARFVPGALGAFDLSIQPSFYTTSIYRYFDGIWYVHLNAGQGAKKEPLDKATFKQAVEELRSLL